MNICLFNYSFFSSPLHNYYKYTTKLNHYSPFTKFSQKTLHIHTTTNTRKKEERMSGYSKIRVVKTTKSKSIDFSDFFSSSHQNPKSITNPYLDLTSKTQLPNPTINTKNKITNKTTTHDSIAEHDEEGEDVDGERFGVILSRNLSKNYSVSSSSSTSVPDHHKFEKQKPTVHQSSLVRRAFSMRRSSSVAEEYCRIHEQLDPISSPPPLPTTTITNEEILTRSKKSKKVKILKVCKRILGF